LILAPPARVNLPLTQEDDNFFQQVNTFGWSFRSLHLPGPAQQAEFGRGICDDLLGEAAYPIPDGGVVSGKTDPNTEVARVRQAEPQLSLEDAQTVVTASVTSYSACSNIALPWVDSSLGKHRCRHCNPGLDFGAASHVNRCGPGEELRRKASRHRVTRGDEVAINLWSHAASLDHEGTGCTLDQTKRHHRC
jgi:hypothetical protein